jgi:hypothetical protein
MVPSRELAPRLEPPSEPGAFSFKAASTPALPEAASGAAERIAVHQSAWRKITAKISTATTTTKMIIMISDDILEV